MTATAPRTITVSRLREVMDYDPDTGIFKRRIATARTHKVGKVAGTITTDGYVRMMVERERLLAHRLAWLYMHGKWPEYEIDHINGVRSDNRITNLRDVTRRANAQNLRGALSYNATGLLGVTYAPRRGKYQSSIRADGKQQWLGYFDTAELAASAYIAAKRELHPGCTI